MSPRNAPSVAAGIFVRACHSMTRPRVRSGLQFGRSRSKFQADRFCITLERPWLSSFQLTVLHRHLFVTGCGICPGHADTPNCSTAPARDMCCACFAGCEGHPALHPLRCAHPHHFPGAGPDRGQGHPAARRLRLQRHGHDGGPAAFPGGGLPHPITRGEVPVQQHFLLFRLGFSVLSFMLGVLIMPAPAAGSMAAAKSVLPVGWHQLAAVCCLRTYGTCPEQRLDQAHCVSDPVDGGLLHRA